MEINMENPAAWTIERGDMPIVATAIHAGHDTRREVTGLFAVPEADRLREEDPFTDRWTKIADNQVVVHRSRFEVDLNRPRERAVYLKPDDAFGLEIWKTPLPDDALQRSLALYDEFYAQFRGICDDLVAAHGRFVVLDLHSYNHRRSGPDAPVDDPAKNPEINVGTGSLDREQWGTLVDRFMEDVAAAPFEGGRLDVRENVRFKGGFLSRWVHEHYATSGCALAIEVKKIYMDEWTGREDEAVVVSMLEVLRSAIPGLLEERAAISGRSNPPG
jgi:N-formylglutamate amidohydrolase